MKILFFVHNCYLAFAIIPTLGCWQPSTGVTGPEDSPPARSGPGRALAGAERRRQKSASAPGATRGRFVLQHLTKKGKATEGGVWTCKKPTVTGRPSGRPSRLPSPQPSGSFLDDCLDGHLDGCLDSHLDGCLDGRPSCAVVKQLLYKQIQTLNLKSLIREIGEESFQMSSRALVTCRMQ